MNKKLTLFPSCSEIVWRLHIPKPTKQKILDALENKKGDTIETDTATYPNDCVGDMLDLLENYDGDIEKVDLELVDNIGGGGNWNYIGGCFEIAKKCFKKEITREEAINKQEDKLWNE